MTQHKDYKEQQQYNYDQAYRFIQNEFNNQVICCEAGKLQQESSPKYTHHQSDIGCCSNEAATVNKIDKLLSTQFSSSANENGEGIIKQPQTTSQLEQFNCNTQMQVAFDKEITQINQNQEQAVCDQMPIQETIFDQEQRLMLVVQHLIQANRSQPFGQRLRTLFNDCGKTISFTQILCQMEKGDLMIIAQHRKLLKCLWENYKQLMTKKEYEIFKFIKYKQILKVVYGELKNQLDFVKLRVSFLKIGVFKQKNILKQTNSFLSELLSTTEKQIMQHHLKQAAKSINQQIMLQRITKESNLYIPSHLNYIGSKKSEYGIYRNQQQMVSKSKEGIFNYRIHRTIAMLDKFGYGPLLVDIQFARDVAVFVIKLVDREVELVVKKMMEIARTSARQIQDDKLAYDEFSYFSISHFKRSKLQTKKYEEVKRIKNQEQMKCGQDRGREWKVTKLKYPSTFDIYNSLRLAQCKRQNILQNEILKQINPLICKKTYNFTKDDRNVLNYFKKQIPQDYISQFIKKKQSDPSSKIVIQPKHIKYIIQNHHFLSKHQLMWRLYNAY